MKTKISAWSKFGQDFIYDDLSTNKGLDGDLANDYINESIEYSQVLLESQSKRLEDVSFWINSWSNKNQNNYYPKLAQLI